MSVVYEVNHQKFAFSSIFRVLSPVQALMLEHYRFCLFPQVIVVIIALVA